MEKNIINFSNKVKGKFGRALMLSIDFSKKNNGIENQQYGQGRKKKKRTTLYQVLQISVQLLEQPLLLD